MKEVISKIAQKIEGIKIGREIDQQAVLLKQMIIPKGETSSVNGLYDLELNNGAVLYYSQGKDFDSFSLNYKMGENYYTGAVLGLNIGKENSIDCLPVVGVSTNENIHRNEWRYFQNGVGYPGIGGMIFGDELAILTNHGVATHLMEEQIPYPKLINTDKAVLNLLKLMNSGETDFGVYNQAVQAAKVK